MKNISVIFLFFKISFRSRVLQRKLGRNGGRASFHADFAPEVNAHLKKIFCIFLREEADQEYNISYIYYIINIINETVIRKMFYSQ